MESGITLKEKWTVGLAFLAFLLFILAEILNNYRSVIFNVTPGSAPQNFFFNMSFFIPINVIAFTLCIIMFFRTVKYWNIWKSRKLKYLVILLTLPIISIWLYGLIKILNLLFKD
jgi:hypothetical protein